MKIKLLFLMLVTIGFQAIGQQVKISKSKVYKVKNIKKEGVVSEIIGANKTHFFVTFVPFRLRHTGPAYTTIKSYDIASMTESGEIKVIDEKESSEKSMNADGAKYMVKEDGLYIFINNKNKENDTYVIYGKHLNNNLSTITPYTKIVELEEKLASYLILKDDKYKNMAVLYTPKINKGENFELLYKFFDNNFKSTSVGHVELPLKKAKRQGEAEYLKPENFKLDQNGNITAFYSFFIDKDERQKGESSSASIVCYINTTKNTVYNVPMRFDDKTVQQFGFIHDSEGKLIVTGFYSQNSKNSRSIDLHGIFYLKIDGQSEVVENSKFTPFPKEFKSKLDKENTVTTKSQKKKDAAKEGSNASFYSFLDVFLGTNSSVTAYCEAIRNTSYTSQSSNGVTRTTYYSLRGTIYYYKINYNGDIEWYNSIKKAYSYISPSSACWYADYTKIYRKDNKDYAMYETTATNELATGLRAYSKKNRVSISTFTTIDNLNGKFKTEQPEKSKVKQKAYETISPSTLYFSDKLALGIGSEYRFKTGWLIAAILTSPLIVPYFVILFSPWSKKGTYMYGKYEF